MAKFAGEYLLFLTVLNAVFLRDFLHSGSLYCHLQSSAVKSTIACVVFQILRAFEHCLKTYMEWAFEPVSGL